LPGPDARAAGMTAWSPSRAAVAAWFRPATPGPWQRPRRTWSIPSPRRCRCVSGQSLTKVLGAQTPALPCLR
jgi:hypothetical protein